MKKSKYKDYMKIEIPSTTDNFEWLCSAIAIFSRRLDASDQEVEDIKTAVREAVRNAVIHAYKYAEGKITIVIGVIADNTIEVVVKDNGSGIADVKKAMEPLYTTCSEEKCSGMGFTIMESFMTCLKVVSTPGKGTTVRMRKKINH